MKRLLSILLLLSAQLSHAKGLEAEIQNYFNSLNMVSNVTGASAYQGQRAGYYTGGSLYARSNIRNVQFVRFSWPKVEAGCGGVDLTFGGLSFVKGKEFVDFSKNVMFENVSLAKATQLVWILKLSRCEICNANFIPPAIVNVI